MQQWQLAGQMLHRWRTRVEQARERRHINEAKHFVRSGGRRPPDSARQAGGKPRVPASGSRFVAAMPSSPSR